MQQPSPQKRYTLRRIAADVAGAVEVVGFTIAEFIPRQVMHLRQIVDGFPLICGTAAD